jgi:DNA-binding response OmpR family regulator
VVGRENRGNGTLARRLPTSCSMDPIGPAGHQRILLVEDDKLERMNLTLVLGREGFELDVAANATEAYALLAHGHYDLVLTDIGLPDGNGFEVLHAAKRADATTKVVLVTGSQSSISPEEARVGGAESLLLKPFALATILEIVRGLMGTDMHGIRPGGVPYTQSP